jgi:hypothetical protein
VLSQAGTFGRYASALFWVQWHYNSAGGAHSRLLDVSTFRRSSNTIGKKDAGFEVAPPGGHDNEKEEDACARSCEVRWSGLDG